MAAYNWIEVTRSCPACNSTALIKCQTHYCSDYDGDDSGRFHDRTYKLGQKMAWWPNSDPRYSNWVESNAVSEYEQDVATECCYSECLNCNAELYVILKFSNCVPTEVLETGLEVDWPKGYYK